MTVPFDGVQLAANKVVEMHKRLAGFIREGQDLADIETFVIKNLEDLKCKSAFYHYPRGRMKFPSHACYSVNNCIVHGTAVWLMNSNPYLSKGDILKIDIGVLYQGWIGDAGWTYMVGEMTEDGRKLIDAGKAALTRGIPTIKAGSLISDWSVAAQSVEKTHGVFMVEKLGGHGVSKKLHDSPFIPNRFSPDQGQNDRFAPNTMIAVEPMIAIGTHQIESKRDRWPIYTKDGSNSAHFEHDLFIGESETVVLTKGLDDLPEVVG